MVYLSTVRTTPPPPLRPSLPGIAQHLLRIWVQGLHPSIKIWQTSVRSLETTLCTSRLSSRLTSWRSHQLRMYRGCLDLDSRYPLTRCALSLYGWTPLSMVYAKLNTLYWIHPGYHRFCLESLGKIAKHQKGKYYTGFLEKMKLWIILMKPNWLICDCNWIINETSAGK